MYIPKIRREDKRPYYVQIESALREAIITGRIPYDTKLPPVRRWASLIGVNVHTLNRVLNNLEKEGLLSRKTKIGTYVRYQKDRKIIKEQNRNKILVICPDDKRLEHLYTQEVLRGIEEEAEIYRFNIDIHCVKENAYSGLKEILNEKKPYGLIIDKEGLPDILCMELLEDFTGPKVIINSTFHLNTDISSVVINYESSGFIATEYLIKKGHKRIAIVIRSSKDMWQYRSDSAMISGYRTALGKYGYPVKKEYEKDGVYYDVERIKKATEELITLDSPPTAIFATDDLIAFKIFQILQNKKIRVPDDISIIGFHNLLYSRTTSPQITTIRTPNIELGRKAVELIIKHRREHVLLEGELIERGSVKEVSEGKGKIENKKVNGLPTQMQVNT
ncbi:MAG: substrate-binding domain-containing protein [bacterium]|nr:substrate-binding domain-containing protein [bacterium]